MFIPSYKEATGATFIHTNAYVNINFLFQIFCDNKNKANLARNTNALVVADLFTRNKLIKAKTSLSANFLFLKFFADTKTYFKSSHRSCPKNFWSIHKKTLVLQSLFNKFTGLQGCCKTSFTSTLKILFPQIKP